MDGKSLDITKEKINALKQLLPEVFTEEKTEAYKAGYKTIAEISKERIRRAGRKIEAEIKEEIIKLETEITKLQSELPTDENKSEIENLQSKIKNLQSQDLGFKVLKLEDSNFKQWQQFPSFGGVSAEGGRGGIFPSFGGVAESRGGRNSKNYFQLPYNPKLKDRARELRQAGNLSEVLFWNQVKNKQFKRFDFDRQKIIGNYIVDFYCSNCNVVIEIDGSSHDTKVEYDAERDAFLESLGLVVIHIPVTDVMNNMSGVMKMLYDHPALKGTPPKEGNEPPRLSSADTPLKEGNLVPNYYVINDGELILLLENATQTIIDAVIAEKPVKVIALDRIFKGNDQLKTNTVLQMRDAGVEFKMI